MKYSGHPLRHGIVEHNLATQDVTVALWRLNEDNTRSLVLAGVDTIDDNMIKVDIVGFGACADDVPITNGEKFWVVVTS